MDDKKKKYVIPNAEVVNFATEDIITASLASGEQTAMTGGVWGNDDNTEVWG